MPLKQGKPISQKNNPNAHVKPTENVATPMSKERFKAKFKAPPKKYTPPPKPDKWKMLKAKLEKTGKISIEDFRSAPEMTAFLDFYNNTLKDERAHMLRKIIKDMTAEIVDRNAPVKRREVDEELKKVDREIDKRFPYLRNSLL